MEEYNITSKKHPRGILLIVFVVLTAMACLALVTSYQLILSGTHSRFMGIKNMSAEKMASVVKMAQTNANVVFDDVANNFNDPEDVINALKKRANMNLDVRGYFAAFVPNYFPEKGTWFEPYVYQQDYGAYEYRQVGSARHNYTRSPWYVQAKERGYSFWSEPYHFYDGTSMSGHYTTFVKPLYDAKGDLVCVCGADMKFEWMAKELKWMDDNNKSNKVLNKYRIANESNFYTIIIDKNGVCLAHPDEKELTIENEEMLKDLRQGKNGVIHGVDIDGETCLVYYGPVEYIDWAIAVVVPQNNILKPMLTIAIILLSMIMIGMLIVWFVCKRS